jgi:phosphohistidine phosphatase SixA
MKRRTLVQSIAVPLAPALRSWAPVAGMSSATALAGDTTAAVETLLRQGRVVLALRHALAPGTFDPPGFRLGDCSTQRNLDDQGRAQARRIGQWFTSRGLQPRRVRSSPWCRCLETARLAFGEAAEWPALGSPRGSAEATNARSLQQLRQALHDVRRQGGFEVWVTHMFVIADLTGQGSASGEGLVLRAAADAASVEVLGRLAPP